MKSLVIICLLVGALALPATAVAQSSLNGYSNIAGVSTGGNSPTSGNAPTTVVKSSSSGSLPFTGLEVGLVAGGGALLLGAGLALRRIGAQRDH
jgi:hypothetical protein